MSTLTQLQLDLFKAILDLQEFVQSYGYKSEEDREMKLLLFRFLYDNIPTLSEVYTTRRAYAEALGIKGLPDDYEEQIKLYAEARL
jgi:hypothetical protein